MSLETLEKVLYDLNMDRTAKERFRHDADGYLRRFPLADTERAMLRAFDVRGLADHGVNTMLTMGFWLELEGSRDLSAYVARMNVPALTGSSGGAGHG